MTRKKPKTVIDVSGVSKSFRLPHNRQTSVKNIFINIFKRKTYEKQEVLKNVSFKVEGGDFFGIVGRNGSGKSTMLKLLAGIYKPTKGNIGLRGKLTPFIELGVGFSPDLTGRENVYLNGALLGFSRREMNEKYNAIVSFAELERFMDQKLKNYSSGMQVRLAFSIAIQAKTEILLLDEVLAVGDENFQRKCYKYFAEIKKAGRTVVFVSHDMDAVKSFCNKVVLIDGGNVIAEGAASKIANMYSRLNAQEKGADSSNAEIISSNRWGSGLANIDSVDILVEGKKKRSVFRDEKIEFVFNITSKEEITNPVVGMVIENEFGHTVFASNTKEASVEIQSFKKGESYKVTFTLKNTYTDGTYKISGAVANYSRTDVFSRVEDIAEFSVNGWPMSHAAAHPKHTIKVT